MAETFIVMLIILELAGFLDRMLSKQSNRHNRKEGLSCQRKSLTTLPR